MFRILQQALKSILFYWKTDKLINMVVKTNARKMHFLGKWHCLVLPVYVLISTEIFLIYFAAELCNSSMWCLSVNLIANMTCQNIQPLKELILDQVPIYQLEVVKKSKHPLLLLQLEPRSSLCNVAKLFNNYLSAKSCNNCRYSSAGMGREPTGGWSLGAEGIYMKGWECHTRTGVLPC